VEIIHVRFGSEADPRAEKRHIGFTPNSDRESGFPQTAVSALGQKRTFDLSGPQGLTQNSCVPKSAPNSSNLPRRRKEHERSECSKLVQEVQLPLRLGVARWSS